MFTLSSVFSLALITLCSAFTFTVTVGIDETSGRQGLGFDPSSINPVAGDTITFTFQLPEYIKNPNVTQHSATQSSFDSPCIPKPNGFDTGLQSTGSVNSNTGSTFNLLVNDTQSLWFFSSANSDCTSGMVLAVNPPTSGGQTAVAFKDRAGKSVTQASATASSSGNVTSTATGPLATGVTAPNAAVRKLVISPFAIFATLAIRSFVIGL